MQKGINEIREAYNDWATQYDTNHNRTRDLEGIVLRRVLQEVNFNNCLEIGCGTGKNTEWLLTKSEHIIAVDLSEKMLAKAQEKIPLPQVTFIQADITQDWDFAQKLYDLVTFSLMLEHIEDIATVIAKATKVLKPQGYIYIGELHSIKQYMGSKARYETSEGTKELVCFTHHISDFFRIAQQHQLEMVVFEEYFDEDDRQGVPRILTFLLQKK